MKRRKASGRAGQVANCASLNGSHGIPHLNENVWQGILNIIVGKLREMGDTGISSTSIQGAAGDHILGNTFTVRTSLCC